MLNNKLTLPITISLFVVSFLVHAQTDAGWAAEKQAMIDYGKRYDSAWTMYEALRKEADDITSEWNAVPDWTGLWERQGPMGTFDPDRRGYELVPKMKGKYLAMTLEQIENAKAGNIWDPHSGCGMPRGWPGMLKNVSPHEFAVTPHQTWHLSQARNEVRRIYTDGRPHTPEEYAYPTPHGDTIGFWDGDRLITHTMYTDGGWVGRVLPIFSEQVEGTEIWQKIDNDTIQADVWIYDSEALEEPWYTRQTYKKVQQEEGLPMRLSYWWNCQHANNIVVPTGDGGTTFLDFDFTDQDDKETGQTNE